MSQDGALDVARESGAQATREKPARKSTTMRESHSAWVRHAKEAEQGPSQKNIIADNRSRVDRWVLSSYTVFCMFLAVLRQGWLLEIVFFVGAIFTAFLFVRRSFARYLSFVIWLFFLAPEVRRLADYFKGEFSDRSLIMLAPLLAAVASAAYIGESRVLLFQRRGVPVLLTVSGILYGYAVGVVNSGLYAASYDLVTWTSPLLLACALLIRWTSYDDVRKAVTRTFLIGGIVISAYGVMQYVDPPGWDAFWLANSGMLTQGAAVPYGLRIFGTMNSSGPYSIALVCCSLVALATRSRLALLCLVMSVSVLLLTLVRSAVGALVIGAFFLSFSLTGKQRRLLLGGSVAIMLACVLLTLLHESADGVAQRMATVFDLKEDPSFEARTGVYQQFMNEMTVNVLGNGLGATGLSSKLAGPGGIVDFDSGILEIPYVLGWPGSILYGAGIAVFIARAVSSCRSRRLSPFSSACAACSLSILSLMTFTNSLVGVSGLFFFVLVTMPSAERRYLSVKPADAELRKQSSQFDNANRSRKQS